MAEYRRRYLAGGTFFFTVVTGHRRPVFAAEAARACLRQVTSTVRRERPFEIVAAVLLPEHWHCIWTLPEDDVDYSKRWGLIKSRFTKLWLAHGEADDAVPATHRRRHERGIWQRRFWEHTIRDGVDLMRHVEYIHYNPVKHGLVRCPHAWPHSSFRRWVEDGYYDQDWRCACCGRSVVVPTRVNGDETFGE